MNIQAQDQPSTSPLGSPGRAKTRRWPWLLALLFVAASLWVLLFVNPLPSDDEMIGHFRAHRGEIEALVKHYREYQKPSDTPAEWNEVPEVRSLKKSSGITTINEAGSIWLPQPYSPETAEYLISLAKTDGRAYFSLKRRSGSLSIRLADPRYGPRTALIKTSVGVIWKDYFFFPVAPKVEGQRLWRPVDIDGQLKRSDAVFENLSWYPREWTKGECVYRAIEPQWFIRMCWGAT